MVVTLQDLRCGDRVRVVQIDPSGPGLGRLEELGLTAGTLVQVVKVAPLGDPVEIEFRGQRICLRRAEAVGLSLEYATTEDP